MSLLVMAEGLVATGVISYIVNLFDTDKNYHQTILLSMILISVAILSSVMNNTPIVVMFIPLILSWRKTWNRYKKKFSSIILHKYARRDDHSNGI